MGLIPLFITVGRLPSVNFVLSFLRYIYTMIKSLIQVPPGVRYLSEWSGFDLYDFPDQCIINKVITGCGMTEFAIHCERDLVVCSPRKILLQNKFDQNSDIAYLLKSKFDEIGVVDIDKDISPTSSPGNKFRTNKKDSDDVVMQSSDLPELIVNLKKLNEVKSTAYSDAYRAHFSNIKDYINCRKSKGLPFKILVTYDSFHIVRDILRGLGISDYGVVVDEFQSILHDSRFKPETEISFLGHISTEKRVYFVSATPMLDKYLESIPEFSKLPYYTLDWNSLQPGRVVSPILKKRIIPEGRTIFPILSKIVEEYRMGNTEKVALLVDGVPKIIQSREAVFYVNSINHICTAITRCNLRPEEVNILCADTPANLKRIHTKCGKKYNIGSVPLADEPRKMFTFCTRTVYLGADFYSDNAKSYIFSDSNIECLAVDIAQDLPQIMGRQRLSINPWKNSAEFYVKTTIDFNKISREVFEERVSNKIKTTNDVLGIYNVISEHGDCSQLYTLVKKLYIVTKTGNYGEDYTSIDFRSGGKMPVPKHNYLVEVSERRAFDIQQVDYKDRFSVFASIIDSLDLPQNLDYEVMDLSSRVNSSGDYTEKLKIISDPGLDQDVLSWYIHGLPDNDILKVAYTLLGIPKIVSLGCNITKITSEVSNLVISSSIDLRNEILKSFEVGKRYRHADIKECLRSIYTKFNITSSAKSVDLKNYFEVKEVTFFYYNTERGKNTSSKGFEILSIKN